MFTLNLTLSNDSQTGFFIKKPLVCIPYELNVFYVCKHPVHYRETFSISDFKFKSKAGCFYIPAFFIFRKS